MKLRSVLKWVVGTFGGTVVTPFLQAPATKLAEALHFDTTLSDRWGPLVQWFSDLAKNPWYIAFAGCIVGIVIGVWLDDFARRFDRRSKITALENAPYTETRLRIRRDPSSDHHVLEMQSNIRNWQQSSSSFGPFHDQISNTMITIRHDVVSIFFEKRTPYARPVVDTFGSAIKFVNFYPMDTSGHVVMIGGLENVGLFEIWFPPPDYYDACRLPTVSPPAAPVPRSL